MYGHVELGDSPDYLLNTSYEIPEISLLLLRLPRILGRPPFLLRLTFERLMKLRKSRKPIKNIQALYHLSFHSSQAVFVRSFSLYHHITLALHSIMHLMGFGISTISLDY
jgi:hypothetical protein